MKAKILLFAASFIATSAMAQGLKSGVDRNNMDFNVKPGENFYEYAAGNWLKSHPLDKEHPMNGAFVDLEELNKKRIREMVDSMRKRVIALEAGHIVRDQEKGGYGYYGAL